MNPIREIWKGLSPAQLLYGCLAYMLGVSISLYLGSVLHTASFWLGLFGAVAILISMRSLHRYFFLFQHPGEYADNKSCKQAQSLLLSTALASLGTFTFITILLIMIGGFSWVVLALFIAILSSYLVFTIPYFHISGTGWEELVSAFLITMVLPALGFSLQTDSLHFLLPLVTFPLFLLLLANILATGFITYSQDIKIGRSGILIHLGWQKSIPTHHILCLAAFLIFSALPLAGVPLRIIWLVFLSIPLIVLQAVWLQLIERGAKPAWQWFRILLICSFTSVIYILILAYWLV